jgi:hypothetical protein
LARTSVKPKSTIDRIRDVTPHYADLLQKNRDLHDRYEALIEEIKPLAEQSRRSQVGWVSQMPKPKPQPIVRHARAVALVGDLLPAQPPEEISPPAPRPSWPGEQRLRELGEETEAITEAIKLLAPEIRRAREEYSRKVAGQRGAEYQAIVEKIVDAAKVLNDELLAHHRFINEQRENGVAWRYFRPLNLDRFGNLDEPFSPLLALITDAVEKGHVGAGKITSLKMPADIAYLQGGS